MDELEQRINHCHTKGMEDEEDYERAAKAFGAAPGNKTKKSVATPGSKFTVYMQHLVVGETHVKESSSGTRNFKK